MKILFLSKKDNNYTKEAATYLQKNFPESTVFFGDRHDPLPQYVMEWEGDILISFISQWIIPEKVLNRAKLAAINFHPGSPEYPGIGCTNFAIYNNEKEYGVTCHHMKSKVDTGNIIAVKRFPINEGDTVYSVTQQSYHKLLELFYEIMNLILQSNPLPDSGESWKRQPYTRKQLNELCYVGPDMSQEEIDRRIKATTYDKPWAFTKVGNHIFRLQ